MWLVLMMCKQNSVVFDSLDDGAHGHWPLGAQHLLLLHPVINCLNFLMSLLCQWFCECIYRTFSPDSQPKETANLGAHRHFLTALRTKGVSIETSIEETVVHCTWHIAQFYWNTAIEAGLFFLSCIVFWWKEMANNAMHTQVDGDVCLCLCLISTGHFANSLGGQWMVHRQLLCQWKCFVCRRKLLFLITIDALWWSFYFQFSLRFLRWPIN